MKYLKSFNENVISNFRNKFLLYNLNWEELIDFLSDNNFDENKINNLINLDNKFLAKGNGGLIYETNDNKIFKITSDKVEYNYARKLINKEFKHLPLIYDVDVISNNYTSLYIIVMEKLKPLPEKLHNCLSIYGMSKHIKNYFRDLDLKFIQYLFRNNDCEEYIQDIVELREELIQSKFDINGKFDFHEKNFMMKNNRLCLIDFLLDKRYYN
jgi:hypothetical protein